MPRSLNKVTLLGHLGKDPELRYTASGITTSSFSLATSEQWKDDAGAKQERTEWHNIVAWRKLAEVCGQYLKKGSKVYVEGKIQTRSWDDKNTGQKRYTTEIVIHDLIMLDSKRDTGDGQAEPVERKSETVQPEQKNEEKDDLPF